jgi:hypothetical protein
MSRIRFSIAKLLLFVLVLGVYFAALRESNSEADAVIFTVTVGVLVVSILLATHRGDPYCRSSR